MSLVAGRRPTGGASSLKERRTRKEWSLLAFHSLTDCAVPLSEAQREPATTFGTLEFVSDSPVLHLCNMRDANVSLNVIPGLTAWIRVQHSPGPARSLPVVARHPTRTKNPTCGDV